MPDWFTLGSFRTLLRKCCQLSNHSCRRVLKCCIIRMCGCAANATRISFFDVMLWSTSVQSTVSISYTKNLAKEVFRLPSTVILWKLVRWGPRRTFRTCYLVLLEDSWCQSYQDSIASQHVPRLPVGFTCKCYPTITHCLVIVYKHVACPQSSNNRSKQNITVRYVMSCRPPS